MSTGYETSEPRSRAGIYILVAIVFVVLAVLALTFFGARADDREAQDKADQLISALEEAGAPTPSQDQIVNRLGSDGGAVCANPNDALSRASLLAMMVNGSGGPGSRPVVVSERVVRGQLAIMEIYCPDEVDDFQEFVDGLSFDDVVRG